MRPLGKTIPPKSVVAACALIGIVALVIALAGYLPQGIDWQETYRPAGLAILRGKSPYSIEGYRIVPWAILPVLPFAGLPEHIGRALYLVVSLAVFGYVSYKLGAKPITLFVFLLSPPVLHCLLNANIDWLPLLGFVLPPSIGLFFVVIKPQIGIGVVIFWLIETTRARGWRETVRTFVPVSVALALSFILFGFWPERFMAPVSFWWNASLWPASIPVGLVLMVTAIRQRKVEYSMAASPCLSPYVLLHSWSGALVSLSKAPLEMIAAVLGLWIMVGLRVISGA
ncbi:MAG: hypothetical protein AB1345_08285 [Chloroflexota bacterium]